MNKSALHILIVVILTGCNSGGGKDPSTLSSRDTFAAMKNAVKISDVVYDSTGESKYKLTLITFDTVNEDEAKFNTLLIVAKKVYKGYADIFKDSIYSSSQSVKFEDYNNDGVNDILVQNFSDARSNWTYYLYLVDPENDLVKIRGFEEIKNPRFIAKHNLIDNYVNSGRNWTEFHRIQGDSIINYGVTIEDGEDDDGNVTYEAEYKKAIAKILKGN